MKYFTEEQVDEIVEGYGEPIEDYFSDWSDVFTFLEEVIEKYIKPEPAEPQWRPLSELPKDIKQYLIRSTIDSNYVVISTLRKSQWKNKGTRKMFEWTSIPA